MAVVALSERIHFHFLSIDARLDRLDRGRPPRVKPEEMLLGVTSRMARPLLGLGLVYVLYTPSLIPSALLNNS
jgi:hypothetical protein